MTKHVGGNYGLPMAQITTKIEGRFHQLDATRAAHRFIIALGAELAVNFFETFGGRLINIHPANIPGSDVANMLGIDKTNELSAHFKYKRRVLVPHAPRFIAGYHVAVKKLRSDEANRSTSFQWPDKYGNRHPYIMTEDVRPYVEALGCERAAALFLQFGGAPLFIPESADGGGAIWFAMTVHDVSRLRDHFGAGQIPRVPLGNDFLIRYFASKNWSKLAIARQVRCTDEGVRRILKAPAERKAFLEKTMERNIRRVAEIMQRRAGRAKIHALP